MFQQSYQDKYVNINQKLNIEVKYNSNKSDASLNIPDTNISQSFY